MFQLFQQQQLQQPLPRPKIKAVDASLQKGVRLAKRRIVVCNLHQCLALDMPISALDFYPPKNLLITCSDKVMCMWNYETLDIIHKFGSAVGAVHKEAIRCCVIHPKAKYVATSSDTKIVIWDLETKKSHKVLEGHKAVVYQIVFSSTGESLISCSADGNVLIWNLQTGKILDRFIKHNSAVRSVQMFPQRPDRITCGLSDGNIVTWDLVNKNQLDTIMADPDWDANDHHQNLGTLAGWMDRYKHHTGSIVDIKISPNNHYLATTSNDHTCKLWDIFSYLRDASDVVRERQFADTITSSLDRPIDILNDSLPKPTKNEPYEFHVGEVPIFPGFHADLLFTLQHEAPVCTTAFSPHSDILATGSLDATCRLWSTKNGDLLFQINTPAEVTNVYIDPNNFLFCSCDSRLLVLDIETNKKVHDLPRFWQKRELAPRIQDEDDMAPLETLARRKTIATSEPFLPTYSVQPELEKESADEQIKNVQKTIHQLIEAANQPTREPNGTANAANIPGARQMELIDMKRLLAHGSVKTTFLTTLVEQFGVDAKNLVRNLKKNDLKPRDILRLIANAPYHPSSILKALSMKPPGPPDYDVLFALILQGKPIQYWMDRHDFVRLQQNDMTSPSSSIMVTIHDISAKRLPEPRETGPKQPHHPKAKGVQFELDSEDELEEDITMLELEQGDFSTRRAPKGKLVHFIPSEQLKILKDISTNQKINPVFFQSLMGREDVNYPGFNLYTYNQQGDAPIDTNLRGLSHVVVDDGKRFNESKTSKQARQKPPTFRFPKIDLSAAKSILQSTPRRRSTVRGLNVDFTQIGPTTPKSIMETVAEPILIRHEESSVKQQFVTGDRFKVKEKKYGA